VYRVIGGESRWHYALCLAAERALLDLYFAMPLPNDLILKVLTKKDESTGMEFEQLIWHQLLRYGRSNDGITLKTYNLKGDSTDPITIRFNDFHVLEPNEKFSPKHNDMLVRGNSKTSLAHWDYILNGTIFIQVSISTFQVHDKDKYATISNAFEKDDFGNNQMESILHAIFKSKFKAELKEGSFKFQKKSKNQWADHNVKCVYLTRQEGAPNHTGKFKQYKDLLYVDFTELSEKLFLQKLVQ